VDTSTVAAGSTTPAGPGEAEDPTGAGARDRVSAAARAILDRLDPTITPMPEFLGACFDAGLSWVHFPVGMGGLGLPAGLQAVADTMLESAGRPVPFRLNPMGYGMAAPTIVAHGSDELRRTLLRPLATTEQIWCQLFSEPGAGSDLAGLATRAVRDGDEWVVDGQKVWTSLAHLARWGLLLARTDPDVPKHRGLTYFVVDMTDPGVEVRPLRQLTGQAEFNEVYFTGARIPDSHRLGAVGDGWRVAMTTLMNERVAIGGSGSVRGSGAIGDALRLWGSRPELRTPALRAKLADLWIQAESNRLTGVRSRAARTAAAPGPESSVLKLVGGELTQAVYEFCVEMLGIEGTRYDSYDLRDDGRGAMTGDIAEIGNLQRRMLRSRANTIEGGTAEVMRNILGERVLGLPGDVRVDTGRPWREVPRG
jgi:alkylation response protein AidB-like acyl-CoA dehydrogenase